MAEIIINDRTIVNVTLRIYNLNFDQRRYIMYIEYNAKHNQEINFDLYDN